MSGKAASSLCTTLRRSSRFTSTTTTTTKKTSSPYFASPLAAAKESASSESSAALGKDGAQDNLSKKKSRSSRFFAPEKTIKSSTPKGTESGDDNIIISKQSQCNPQTKAKSKRPVKRAIIFSSQESSPKKTSKPTRRKSPTKKNKPKVERTRSFEPAWWGNILTNNHGNNIGGRSFHPHAHAATPSKPSFTNNNNSIKNDSSCYPPIHTLIIGTHPSIASLTQNQFYGHPLNAFWYIAGDCLGFRRSLAISEKTGKPYKNIHEHLRYGEESIVEYSRQLEWLVGSGFALWDIIGECEREGSLDEKIEHEVVNPIREFCEGTLPVGGVNKQPNIGKSIKRIIIANGTTGGGYFVKHFSDWFLEGKICAGEDEMSQRVFKSLISKAKKIKSDGMAVDHDDGNKNVIQVICLPSVSPAAASFTYVQKREAWERLCYQPGLKDYEEWKKEQLQSKTELKQTPKRKSGEDDFVTPTKAKKTKSSGTKSSSASKSKPSNMAQIVSSDLAKLSPENKWVDLLVPPEELRPSATLTNGQCFNWMVVVDDSATRDNGKMESEGDNNTAAQVQQSAWGTHDAKEWVGPLQNRIYSIRETPTSTEFRVLHGPLDGAKEYLEKYFRLETKLAPLYEEWSKADTRLATIASCIPGVRILRQDPVECMFSFICSSNNNIPRITKMLSSFREKYGTFMMEIPTRIYADDNNDDETFRTSSMSLFSFPTLVSLQSANEEELREMGLGYRAKYIVETRDLLQESGGDDHLMQLRSVRDSQAVQEELIKFSGIGRKVGDCIALFSLDQDDAIPVDVHVQHIASRDYDPSVLGGAKSITPTIYKKVGDLFRDRFQNYAGWAHSLLFVAELPSFRGVLPLDMLREMDEWREQEKQKKAESKKKQDEI